MNVILVIRFILICCSIYLLYVLSVNRRRQFWKITETENRNVTTELTVSTASFEQVNHHKKPPILANEFALCILFDLRVIQIVNQALNDLSFLTFRTLLTMDIMVLITFEKLTKLAVHSFLCQQK